MLAPPEPTEKLGVAAGAPITPVLCEQGSGLRQDAVGLVDR